LLAPEIVEAIVEGRQGDETTLPRLMKGMKVEWETPCGRTRGGYTLSFNSLAGWKAIFLLAAIWIVAPVPGFLPVRAGRART